MKHSVWILLFITANVYAQTPEAVIYKDYICSECQRRLNPQDTIENDLYIINNVFLPAEPEPYPTKRQKTKRWIERVLFFGAIGAVIYLKVKDDD